MIVSSNSAVTPEIVAAAADWFSLLQEDTVTERDFQEWQQWLNAAPEHIRAYREIEESWRLIGEVKPVPWVTPEEMAGRSSRQRLAPRAMWSLAAAVVLGIALSFSLYVAHRNVAFSTKTAEQRSVRLSDGSRITLGAQSRITQLFDEQSRRIELNFGEAYFEVAHDPRRPFKVIAGTSEIRAIGTAFNVRSTIDRVLVTVTEGRVALISSKRMAPQQSTAAKRSAPAQIMLSAGEQATVTQTGASKEESAAAATAVTWLQGRFEYRGEELRHVVDDMNRYADRPIVITDESLARLRYSGTVFPDHLDEWLQGISGALPVKVQEGRREREIVSNR